MIGDETAVSKALLPSKNDIIKVGEVIRLENVDAEVINERIVIVTKKESKIYQRKKAFGTINIHLNISDALWEE